MAPEEGFVVIYWGQPIAFTQIDRGFAYQCPLACCRAYHWVALRDVERPHKITSAPGEPVTIEGSLQCPCRKNGQQCSWHVHVVNGEARDC
jgi:hypothetical protein